MRALEVLLERDAAPHGSGTLTPAGAFGPEWARDLPGVRVVRGPEILEPR